MEKISPWQHKHVFLGAGHRVNERRTRIVIVLTASMMILEITAGLVFGSMALLADGWHMASHAAALSISALGYVFARRYANSKKFSFGTGKISDLAGYSSALLLGFIAILMAYESVKRFFSPVAISFDEAIIVAVLGLLVNLSSALILRENPAGGDRREAGGQDLNIKSAYLHVLADALTSLLAILALSAGRFLGWVWMDPLMGMVGATVIFRWSLGLTRETGKILLDMHGDKTISEEIKRSIEERTRDRISDLHLWSIGPGHFSAILAIATEHPRPPDHYKAKLAHIQGLDHVTVEVNTPEQEHLEGPHRVSE